MYCKAQTEQRHSVNSTQSESSIYSELKQSTRAGNNNNRTLGPCTRVQFHVCAYELTYMYVE